MMKCFYCDNWFVRGDDLKEHLRAHATHATIRKSLDKWIDFTQKTVSSLVSNYPQIHYYKEGKRYNLAARDFDKIDAIECHTKEEMEAINEVWFKLTDCKPYSDEKPGRTIFDFNTDSWVTVNSVYEFIDSCFA